MLKFAKAYEYLLKLAKTKWIASLGCPELGTVQPKLVFLFPVFELAYIYFLCPDPSFLELRFETESHMIVAQYFPLP